MTITELVKRAHDNARTKGFWEDYSTLAHDLEVAEDIDKNGQLASALKALINNAISTRLMLIVSELGEALEGLRQGDRDNFNEELADVAIRLGDLCGGLGIDLEAEVAKKMERNKERPYKHGKAF